MSTPAEESPAELWLDRQANQFYLIPLTVELPEGETILHHLEKPPRRVAAGHLPPFILDRDKALEQLSGQLQQTLGEVAKLINMPWEGPASTPSLSEVWTSLRDSVSQELGKSDQGKELLSAWEELKQSWHKRHETPSAQTLKMELEKAAQEEVVATTLRDLGESLKAAADRISPEGEVHPRPTANTSRPNNPLPSQGDT